MMDYFLERNWWEMSRIRGLQVPGQFRASHKIIEHVSVFSTKTCLPVGDSCLSLHRKCRGHPEVEDGLISWEKLMRNESNTRPASSRSVSDDWELSRDVEHFEAFLLTCTKRNWMGLSYTWSHTNREYNTIEIKCWRGTHDRCNQTNQTGAAEIRTLLVFYVKSWGKMQQDRCKIARNSSKKFKKTKRSSSRIKNCKKWWSIRGVLGERTHHDFRSAEISFEQMKLWYQKWCGFYQSNGRLDRNLY